jgi:hypothetical protein
MRSVFRSVFVALVAVLAVGAAVSASAFAAPVWEVKSGGVWKALGAGESKNVVVKSTTIGRLSAPNEAPYIECSAVQDKGGWIENTSSGGVGELKKIEFTGCRSIRPEGCEVKSPGETAGHISTAASVLRR